jgi:hypothetical protein
MNGGQVGLFAGKMRWIIPFFPETLGKSVETCSEAMVQSCYFSKDANCISRHVVLCGMKLGCAWDSFQVVICPQLVASYQVALHSCEFSCQHETVQVDGWVVSIANRHKRK